MLKLRYLLLIVTLSTLSPYLLLAVTPRSYEFVSPVYKVDCLYKSMTGPHSSTAFSILEKDTPELLSVYNNTTSSDQDVMTVIYLYVLDKEFINN